MSIWATKDRSAEKHGDIEAESTPEEEPGFRRLYTVKFGGRAKMTITVSTFLGRRDAEGELIQSNDRWVAFDPERVADEILDAALVPLIERKVKEIMALDREFMASGPHGFTDERGQRWVRA